MARAVAAEELPTFTSRNFQALQSDCDGLLESTTRIAPKEGIWYSGSPSRYGIAFPATEVSTAAKARFAALSLDPTASPSCLEKAIKQAERKSAFSQTPITVLQMRERLGRARREELRNATKNHPCFRSRLVRRSGAAPVR